MAQLKSLNVAQARALARQRLDAVPELAELRKRHKSLLWPLHEKDLEALIPKEGCPARLLITHCRAGAASHAPVSQDGEEDKAVPLLLIGTDPCRSLETTLAESRNDVKERAARLQRHSERIYGPAPTALLQQCRALPRWVRTHHQR
ncbi:MAG: hypothetical protein LC647_03495 [Beggiatoa sp.]|nr:hypothetical protein [Beggiatoa sp.]